MIETWTRGLDTQLTIDVKQNYRESLVIRKRLKQILKDKVEEAHNASLTKDKYDCPNWALLQADAMGYERALKLIDSLLD